MPNSRTSGSYAGLELLRQLAEERWRIFSFADVQDLAAELGMVREYIAKLLYSLEKAGWIKRLHKGLYALSEPLLGGSALGDFEIAMHLVSPSAISHLSAMNFHGLTQRTPDKVFVLTPKTWSPRQREGGIEGSRYKIGNVYYQFVKVLPTRYFGIETVWLSGGRVNITNLERTFIDAITRPHYCGGFARVIQAMEKHHRRLDLELMAEYALNLDVVTAKRLGWMLERLAITTPSIGRLLAMQVKGYRRLDPSAPHAGKHNSRWNLQENANFRSRVR